MTLRSSATTSRRNRAAGEVARRPTSRPESRCFVATPLAGVSPARTPDRRAAARPNRPTVGADAAAVAAGRPAVHDPASRGGLGVDRLRPTPPSRLARADLVGSIEPASLLVAASLTTVNGVARGVGGRVLGRPSPASDSSLTDGPRLVYSNIGAMVRTASRVITTMQGRQDLNLQPAVLETAALPIEPRPSALHRRCRTTFILGCTGAYSTDGWRSQASSGTPQIAKCKARRWYRTNGDGGPHPADRGSGPRYGSRAVGRWRGPTTDPRRRGCAASTRRRPVPPVSMASTVC